MKLFGSSGIRGRFNDLITPEFVCRIGQAVGSIYDGVVVGWDTRTTSPLLANAMFSGLLSVGSNAYSAGMVSTPTLANAAREFKAGIMITASHNPPTDNGVKLWNPDGSSFGTAQMEAIEKLLLGEKIPVAPWDRLGNLRSIDWAIDRHIQRISREIGPLHAKVVVDCGNGAACIITPFLLRQLGCEVITLNSQPDGSFPGRGSEPTEENTKLLAKLVVESGADIGIAHDGDGDRMVAIDEKGNFAGGDAMIPLFCKLEGKSKVVVPINASMAVDRYLDKVKVVRCRVGDVYVSEKIKEVGADFGGEPSGTWVFPKISYCPDGIYAAARLVQITQKRPLSEQLAEIPKFSILKKRIDLPQEKKHAVMVSIAKALKALKPAEISELDGIRAVFKDGWILLRPSGTEPKLKIVVEAESDKSAKKLFNDAMDIVKEVLN
jgi:phosphoglucosamine mutase